MFDNLAQSFSAPGPVRAVGWLGLSVSLWMFAVARCHACLRARPPARVARRRGGPTADQAGAMTSLQVSLG